MAEEADDGHGNAAEERSQILQLQSEQFRKQEQLDRLRQRSRALEEELQQRENELSEVQRRCNEEKHHGVKHVPGEDRARAAAAEDNFLRSEVQKLLQSRVPAMAPITEDGEEEGNPQEKASAQKQEETGKQVHDTVLVSYVASQDGRQEDFKVSYRIDSHTTVEQLHRDACAYWGCSRKDYTLWKIDADDKPAHLFPPKAGESAAPKLLQDAEVLNPAEAAHLHLCRDSDEIKKARLKERERERKEGERKAQPTQQEGHEHKKSYDVLKTLKHGLGYALNDKQPEEFVDAFRSWPGIYNLLRTRGRAPHHRTKWRHVPFSDILGYLFLILLSALCIGYRWETDLFLLREGVAQALVRGVPEETFQTVQLSWLTQSRGVVSGGPPLTELSPGIAWDVDAARVNGSVPGLQFLRSSQGVAQDLRAVQVSGHWAPPPGVCAEFSVLLAAGTQPPAADAPRISVAWNCTNVTVVGPNGTRVFSDAPACLNFASTGGLAKLSLNRDGNLSLSAGAGCEVGIWAGESGNWSDLGHSAPPYVFLAGEGGGDFQNISITGTVPTTPLDFTTVRTFKDFQSWFAGPFLYQILNPSSTLNRHYRVASIVRVRQQMVKTRRCDRDQVPFNLDRQCEEVAANLQTEDTRTMPPLPGSAALPPSARVWVPDPVGTGGLQGDVQSFYGGSGYVLDVPPMLMNMASAAALITYSLSAYTGAWLSTKTRLLSVELLLENRDTGGHVVANLYVECTPGGLLHPLVDLEPARFAPSYGSDVADGLDIARWVIVVVLLLGVRVWRETKRQVLLGRNGLGFVLSFGGLVDAATVAAFFALQFMRLNGRPRLPEPAPATFRSYSQAARNLRQLGILESVLLLMLILRFASFMRFFPSVFRFFKSFGRAFRMFCFYMTMFGPVFLGNAFLAHAIYGAHLFGTSTFMRSFASLVLAIKESYDMEKLLFNSRWTIPFLAYFWLTVVTFFLFGFLAISVHAYFEVQLVEGSDPNAEKWSLDDWLQWMLWQPVYRYVTRGAGGEKRAEGEVEGEQDEEEESSDEEEHEEKRG